MSPLVEYFVLFTLISHTEAGSKILYIKDHKTWHDAQQYCKFIRGNLISKTQLNRTKTCVTEHEEFWIGEVTTLSSWIEVIGCYDITSYVHHPFRLLNADPAVCEHKCKAYDEFGLQGSQCLCLNQELTYHQVSANNCGHSCYGRYPTGLCGGNDSFYTVYSRASNIVVYQQSPKFKCVAGECNKSYGFKKYARPCTDSLRTICRIIGREGIGMEYKKWNVSSNLCYNQNRYLIKGPNSNTPCQPLSENPAWLSIFRNILTVNINDYFESDELYKCSSAIHDRFVYRINSDNACYDTSITRGFFCEIDSFSDEVECGLSAAQSSTDSLSTTISEIDTTTSNMLNSSKDNYASHPSWTLTSSLFDNVTRVLNKTNQMEQHALNKSNIGIIIGVVVPICVVIAVGGVLLVFICIYRKRKCKSNCEDIPSSEQKEGVNNGFAYDLANLVTKQQISESKRNIKYEIASIPKHRKSKNQNKVKENDNSDTGYEFASIPKLAESDYIYLDTVEGEYDLLNRKDDRKIENTDGEDTSVYSRTGGFEGTYDTTYSLSHIDDISDTYDHATTSNEVGHNNDDADPYDHSNMC